jgi:integrase
MFTEGDGKEKPRFGWDRGLDYDATYNLILKHLMKTEDPHDVFLLTQLRNGSRIGEAVEAIRQACQQGLGPGGELRIRTEKGGNPRLVVIPEDVPKYMLQRACEWLSSVRSPKVAISKYSLVEFGFNTHSLRYAFITKLVKQGIPPSIIAKITGHKKLDRLITYTESKIAEELLRKLPERSGR